MSIIIKSTIVFPRGTYLHMFSFHYTNNSIVYTTQYIRVDILKCEIILQDLIKRHDDDLNLKTPSGPQVTILLKLYTLKCFTIMTSKFNYYITASSFLGISSQLCPISFRSPNCHVNFYGWNRSSDQRQTVLVVSQILERIDFVEISGVYR